MWDGKFTADELLKIESLASDLAATARETAERLFALPDDAHSIAVAGQIKYWQHCENCLSWFISQARARQRK